MQLPRFALTLFTLFVTVALFAQTDLRERFQEFAIQDERSGKVEFCTFRSTITKRKPIMLFIHGSGNEPTFAYHKDLGSYAWKGFLEVERYKDEFHVICVSKPGVPLFDTVAKDPVNFQTSYPLNAEFTERYSLEWRAEAASLIIDRAMELLPVDPSRILVIGHSQGGQVAPKVAVLNKKVTHVVMLNSNTLNHLYDFVLQERLASLRGEQSYVDGQTHIDSLLHEYKQFLEDPTNTKRTWNDETYLRWASFSDETPLDNMLKLDIPIYMVASGKDLWGSFIMNTDYAPIAFLQHGRTNLTYRVLPNADHFLQDEIEEAGRTRYVDLKPQLFRDIVRWSTGE